MLDADNAENISSSSTKESCRTSMCCRNPPPPLPNMAPFTPDVFDNRKTYDFT